MTLFFVGFVCGIGAVVLVIAAMLWSLSVANARTASQRRLAGSSVKQPDPARGEAYRRMYETNYL